MAFDASIFELLQPTDLRYAHRRILLLPPIKGGFGDPHLSADLGHSRALFGLPKRKRDLFLRTYAAFRHGSSSISVFLPRHLILHSKVQDARKNCNQTGSENWGKTKTANRLNVLSHWLLSEFAITEVSWPVGANLAQPSTVTLYQKPRIFLQIYHAILDISLPQFM